MQDNETIKSIKIFNKSGNNINESRDLISMKVENDNIMKLKLMAMKLINQRIKSTENAIQYKTQSK